MRALLLGAAFAALTAVAPAFAADWDFLPPPARFSWTGCHIGGHLGLLSSQDAMPATSGGTGGFSSTGFVGGGQIGCDYQFAPGWVGGVEGRAAWTSLKNTTLALGAGTPAQFSVSNDFLASTTARVGYSVDDGWLVFIRGGAAWTHEKADIALTTPGGTAIDPSATTIRTGWTIGTGVEWVFAPRWTATVEYNYYDFGTRDFMMPDSADNLVVKAPSVNETIHAVTAGVNYRF